MSGLRRLSDTKIGGGLVGATSGQVPVYNSTTGHAGPGTPKFYAPFSGYNLSPTSMRKFRAAMALAKTGGTNAHIVCYGDSITSSIGATNAVTGGWTGRLRALIDTSMGSTRGTGFIPICTATITGGGATPMDSRIVLDGSYGGSWGGYGSFGPMCGTGVGTVTKGGIWYTIAAATPHTCTFGPVTTDQFIIYYWQTNGSSGSNNGGVFAVTIDGGAPASGVSSLNTAGSLAVLTATTSPASQGSHTLVLTGPTVSGVPALIGLEARANGGTGGVRLSEVAFGGIGVQPFNNGTAGNVAWGQLATEFDMLAPDLSIIMLETNDSNSTNNTSIANYKTYLQNMITRAKLTGDVLLVSTVPQGSTVPSPITLAQYTQALYDLCDSNDIAMVDIAARFGAYGTSPAFYYDTYHPNDKGHQDIAAAIYQALRFCGVGL